MPTFITNDGEKIEAANAKDLVKRMAASSFSADDDEKLTQFMKDVADRSERAASVTLRWDNCDNFVADMLMHGLLKTEG